MPVLGETNADTGELRDVLEFTGAARAFNYNTFGSDFTYKFGTRLSVDPGRDVARHVLHGVPCADRERALRGNVGQLPAG